jgi:hypothetical protein
MQAEKRPFYAWYFPFLTAIGVTSGRSNYPAISPPALAAIRDILDQYE